MRTPVQALLWEQWRRTWKAIPFTLAVLMIILWFLPQYFLEYSIDRWATEVGLIMCGILSGIFCIILQGEGGARGGTPANRHFVLPVSSTLIAIVPIFVFCAVLLFTLATGVAFVAFYGDTLRNSLSQPEWPSPIVLLSSCFVLAYSVTIGIRDNVLLRVVLMLLMLFLLLMIMDGLLKIVSAAALTILVLGTSIPAAAFIIRRDRHKRTSQHIAGALLVNPVSVLADNLLKFALPVPEHPRAALFWRELRGGKKLIVPAVISLSGILIFLTCFYVASAGDFILTRLYAPPGALTIWISCVTLTGAGLFIYMVARFGTSLAGGSPLFAPWSHDASFWKRQPVCDNALATAKLKAIMLLCLWSSLCLCLVIAFVPVFIEAYQRGFSKVLRDAANYLQENGLQHALVRGIARPVLITALVLWTFSGMVSAIALTGRKWFYTFGFTTLAFAALAVLRLFSLSSSWKYYDSIQPLKAVMGTVVIVFSVAPLVWALLRSYADRLTLVLLAACCLLAEIIIFSALHGEFTGSIILDFILFALPYAPLGLVPVALRWGRRL